MDNAGQNGWNEWSRHVLKELERLNDNYEDIKTEISDIKEDIGKVKALQYSLNEIRDWKKSVDDVASPSQLKDLRDEVARLKTFKTVSTTVWAVIQILMGFLIAFKDKLF
jgi:archaellum component FlaC